MIRCSSFIYVALLYSLLANVSVHRSQGGVGHHGSRGTMAAAMVHRVLLIDMCLVLDLHVGMVLTYRRSTLLLDNWSSLIF